MSIRCTVVDRDSLSGDYIDAMYSLMDQFYTNMDRAVFLRDLSEKHKVILGFDESDNLVGFSTQQIIEVEIVNSSGGPAVVRGVFSGDTIIHRDHWGSSAPFKTFLSYFLDYGKNHTKPGGVPPEFYWFLISKGYKTYRTLPVFFKEFYPGAGRTVPEREQAIMHAYARQLYGDDYNPRSGVIEYRTPKDRLRDGVAEIEGRALHNPDVIFFTRANPFWKRGNDLVCLVRLCRENLLDRAKRLVDGYSAEPSGC